MSWDRSLLTVCFIMIYIRSLYNIHLFMHQDSGGFQMVSLLDLAEITEVNLSFNF